MSELPKVFSVLDEINEINEIHLETTHALRSHSMTKTEERVTRLFEIAKQQALDIYAAEQKLANAQPSYLVRSDLIPPGHIIANEAMLLESLNEPHPAFTPSAQQVLKIRIKELFKKP